MRINSKEKFVGYCGDKTCTRYGKQFDTKVKGCGDILFCGGEPVTLPEGITEKMEDLIWQVARFAFEEGKQSATQKN